MDILNNTYDIVVGTIVPFIIVLTIVVFVHEMGHYLVGRWCGIRILTFSIGFGPEVAGFNDRHGTRWKISAVPLGGYVKFFGDDNAASTPNPENLVALSPEERARTFLGASLWRRTLTVAAGPVANFVLAIVIFAVMFGIYGKPIMDPVVSSVQPASAAAEAGLESGDRILELDGKVIDTFDDIRNYVTTRPGVEINLTVDRGGRILDFVLVPRRVEIDDGFGNEIEVGQIGIIADTDTGNFRRQEFGPVEALGEGVSASYFIISRTIGYLGNIIIGREKPDQLGGPVKIAVMSGQVAAVGIGPLLQFVAVLSVSIGFLNLLPIPILDGGHLAFYLIEFLRGKPVGEKAQEVAFKIGLSLLLMLMLFVTWNDVT